MPFPKGTRAGRFQLLASGNPSDGALTINSDAKVLGATVQGGESIEYSTGPERHLYLVSSAPVRVNGTEAAARDGVAISGEQILTIEAQEDAELVLVDAR
jgi:redox-sensitive bicupin YhaK (pirin superfamily)